jgi:hypothetical protein
VLFELQEVPGGGCCRLRLQPHQLQQQMKRAMMRKRVMMQKLQERILKVGL